MGTLLALMRVLPATVRVNLILTGSTLGRMTTFRTALLASKLRYEQNHAPSRNRPGTTTCNCRVYVYIQAVINYVGMCAEGADGCYISDEPVHAEMRARLARCCMSFAVSGCSPTPLSWSAQLSAEKGWWSVGNDMVYETHPYKVRCRSCHEAHWRNGWSVTTSPS